MLLLLLMSTFALVASDVSHLQNQEDHNTDPPPRPYAFTYTAGRYPGHADRQHTEVSDGSGVIRGQFSYIDPRQKIRTVQYVADKQGFHPILNDAPPEHPKDTEAVKQAKNRHYNLYNAIAEDHQQHPYSDGSAVPRQSAAVALATAKHAQLFKVIAEQHARIAAEREALQSDEEDKQQLQELGHSQY